MIAIGSKALLHNLPHLTSPEQADRLARKDYDVIMSITEFMQWQEKHKSKIVKIHPTSGVKYKAIIETRGKRTQYEIELGFEGTSAKWLLDNQKEVCSNGKVITGLLFEPMFTMNLQYLLLTKRSHLVYPVHFEKNMADYQLLKGIVGDFNRTDLMQEYYQLRSAEARERFKKFKTPKLNVTNEDFFSSKLAVDNYFIHDDIHEVVKHHDRPVYEMMKRDFNKAWCEKDMFFELPYMMQVQCVQEEAYTIALERYIIPHAQDWEDPFLCYQKALKRICTTLCSGWFRDFAIENHDEVIRQYDKNFVNKLRKAYENGEIKLIEGKTAQDLPELVEV